MTQTTALARSINHRYCWDAAKQHLWPLANRHVWRIAAMYSGQEWSEVDTVEQCLAYPPFPWMISHPR